MEQEETSYLLFPVFPRSAEENREAAAVMLTRRYFSLSLTPDPSELLSGSRRLSGISAPSDRTDHQSPASATTEPERHLARVKFQRLGIESHIEEPP